jgi:MinD-like ATPase involved in chromosome partitioning or flagellar assembly
MDDRDYPDGSVGRYVRERWGATAPVRGPRPRAGAPAPRQESDAEAAPPRPAPPPRTAPPPRAAVTVPPLPAEPRQARVDNPPQEGPPVWRPPADVPDPAEPPPALPDLALPDPARPVPDAVPRTPPRGAARWVEPGAVAAQEAQRARRERTEPTPPTDLSSARLLRPARRPPQSGWRRFVYVVSGRLINPGESPLDIRKRELTARVNQPLLGCYKIAMLSLKGGVGKTTVTATLGATFASLRGDRVIALDANPDRGTLSQKIPLETSATVRNLLRDAQRVRRYTDVRVYTSQGPSRLEVLASEQDPAVSEAFSEDDYRRTVTLLEHFYNIVLTDCGTGLMHSAMYGVLGLADQLIIVSSGSIDGARSASGTMDWLDAHGHGDLVKNSVAVINCVHRSAGGVDLDRVAEHFAARCRAVVRIPFDAHLEEGAEVDLDRLEPATRLALLKLAAAVADAFEGPPA